MGYLVGDVLIAAAFLSYIGPFLSNYREDLVVRKWLVEVRLFLNIFMHNGQHQVRDEKGQKGLFLFCVTLLWHTSVNC